MLGAIVAYLGRLALLLQDLRVYGDLTHSGVEDGGDVSEVQGFGPLLPFGKTYQVLNSFPLDHLLILVGASWLVTQLPESLTLLLRYADLPKVMSTLHRYVIEFVFECLLFPGDLLVPSVLFLLAVEVIVIV